MRMSSVLGRQSKCIQTIVKQALRGACEGQRLVHLRSTSSCLAARISGHSFQSSPTTDSRRRLHYTPLLQQNDKPSAKSEVSQSLKANDQSSADPAQQQLSKQAGRGRQVSPLVDPTKRQLKERETYLPNHDTNRLTKESREFETKAVSIFEVAARVKGRNREGFLYALQKYDSKESLYKRGSLEMVYAGLGVMEEFGVVKDLEMYKALLQVFPAGKMIPRNAWQVEFMHYPRQQQATIDLLEQMEYNAVIPDENFGDILKDRFGLRSHATRKYRRMKYWLPKFKYLNPYPIPFELPTNPEELALIALKRMCVDRETKYTVWKTSEEEEECEEDTFIASAQSPMQKELLSRHNSEEPLFVEGPYHVYLRTERLQYFLLRAEPNINDLMKQKQREKEENDDENLFEWKNFFEEEEASKELRPVLSVHEQEDSTILALTITGTSSKASAITWVRYLEKDNPLLAGTPVLFRLSSGSGGDVDVIGDNRSFREHVAPS